jgi:uncharacterized RDD family membrane protein YckC
MATSPDAAARTLAQRPAETSAVATAAPAAILDAPVAGYGGLVTRAIAAAIDALLVNLAALAVAAVVALVLSIFPVSHGMKTILAAIGGVLFAIWVVAYFVTFWTTTGQTPGDRVMRVVVVREDGGRLKPLRALLRLLGACIGLVLFLGYVPILLNDRRRALHDWMAGTVVINQPTTTRGTSP